MVGWLMKTGTAFAVQLVICMIAFVRKFPRREKFLLRIAAALVMYFGFSYCTFLLRLVWPDGQKFLAFVLFEAVWGVGIAGIMLCFDVKPFSALYAGIGGYMLQHLVYGVFAIIRYYVDDMPEVVSIILLFLPYVIVSLGFYDFFIKHNRDYSSYEDRSAAAVVLALLVIFLNVFLSRMTSYGDDVNRFVSVVVCRLYSVTCCSLVLFELFGLFKQNALKREKMILEHLLEHSKGQQRVIGDSIDFINIKCHDLKKQIASLKQITNAKERNELIDELERSVLIYDSVAKTGNAAIDLVFTEFSWRCLKNAIRFDYIIDGSDYDFMKLEDVYSMFFNSLDNAIESVLKEEDEDKRMISIKSVLQGDLLYIQILNYCHIKPEFKDGLPITTKNDKDFHGYGTKSIRYIVEKYGGSVRMDLTGDSFFELEILLNTKNGSAK